MRLLAAIGFALFIAVAGVSTHLAAGGALDLSMIPGLEDTALEFGWIDERGPDARGDTPSPAIARDTTAGSTGAATATTATTASASDSAPSPDPRADALAEIEEALNGVETAAGVDNSQVAQASSSGAVMNVIGRASAARAGADGTPPVLAVPVACRPGVDCLVSSFVDMAEGESYRDFSCGALSYNDHKGTDIRLPSQVEMMRGYPVVAAAPGRVVTVRDGMPDANFNLFGRDAVTDRGLGNVVGIDHGNGWRTYYGHMRQSSLKVEQGEEVEAGQPLGLVGLSGLTEFPHVHFQVMRDNTPIDPFTGLRLEGGCGIEGTSLWAPEAAAALKYPRTLLLRFGFSDRVLNEPAVEYMLFKDEIDASKGAIVLHAHLSGLQERDRVEIRIYKPNGEIFADAGIDITELAQSRTFPVGKKDLTEPPDTGTYRGELRYFRQSEDGPQQLFEDSVTVEVR